MENNGEILQQSVEKNVEEGTLERENNEATTPVKAEPDKKEGDAIQKVGTKLNAIAACGGIISGILSFIFGIIMFAKKTGYMEFDKEYGGDAYTGIQNAAAQTASNVKNLAEATKNGFAFLLIAIGLIAIFYFAMKQKDKRN